MLRQLQAILWKNWLLKKTHAMSTLAEIALPIGFMGLLILIKSITSVSDSPNIAYHCGQTYPWYYDAVYPYNIEQCVQNHLHVMKRIIIAMEQKLYKILSNHI